MCEVALNEERRFGLRLVSGVLCALCALASYNLHYCVYFQLIDKLPKCIPYNLYNA
jgi:hypothetical protein